MESKYFINKHIINFQNIKVTTKRWKALVVLPLCMDCVKKDNLTIKSMFLISSILN
jgi:hypothetical protein